MKKLQTIMGIIAVIVGVCLCVIGKQISPETYLLLSVAYLLKQ